jgi:hypothetical protein
MENDDELYFISSDGQSAQDFAIQCAFDSIYLDDTLRDALGLLEAANHSAITMYYLALKESLLALARYKTDAPIIQKIIVQTLFHFWLDEDEIDFLRKRGLDVAVARSQIMIDFQLHPTESGVCIFLINMKSYVDSFHAVKTVVEMLPRNAHVYIREMNQHISRLIEMDYGKMMYHKQ